MRLYYKIWLTNRSKDSDIISFAFTDDIGRSIYCEVNDYSPNKLSRWADNRIVPALLGQKGINDVIPQIHKLACFTGGLDFCREKFLDYTEGHKNIELIGYSNYYEIQSLLWLLDWDNEKRQLGIVNMDEVTYNNNEDLLESVTEFLPTHNALRAALTYKHIVRRFESKRRK